MEEAIVNRVTGSGLVTLNLEEHFPHTEIAEVDLAPLLVNGLMLRENDLRDFVRSHDWSQYKGKAVAVHCTADAIIPTWAFMLVAIAAQPFAERVIFGGRDVAMTALFLDALHRINWDQFKDAKVVVKGCSDLAVPEAVYLEATARLRPLAASIMYGEPCSTVPLFKRPKQGA